MSKIDMPEFETLEDVQREMSIVCSVITGYSTILRSITNLDAMTDLLEGRMLELMTEYDDCDHLNSSTIDTIRFLRQNIKKQIHKFNKYDEELSATYTDMKEQKENDDKFGNEEAQIKDQFNNSRGVI